MQLFEPDYKEIFVVNRQKLYYGCQTMKSLCKLAKIGSLKQILVAPSEKQKTK